MSLTNRQLKWFLFTVQGLGAAFSGVFLIVYLLGLRDLPESTVYHSEPAFRTPLSVLGVLFLILILSAIVLSFLVKRKR